MKKLLRTFKKQYEELTFKEVLEKYSGVIKKYASPYQNIYDLDDLFQVGSMALFDAYENYDIETGYTFTNYVHKKVNFAIKKYHRNMTYKFDNKFSKVREIMTCDMTELLEKDNSNFYEYDFEKYLLIQEIVEIIKGFKIQKRRIWYFYLLGYNKTEIGKKVGVSGWWVTVSMKEDIKNIRKNIRGA